MPREVRPPCCLKRRCMNTRRCSRREMHRSPLARCARHGTKNNERGPVAVQEALRACIRQVLGEVHHRHDGMQSRCTAEGRADWLFAPRWCRAETSPFRTLRAPEFPDVLPTAGAAPLRTGMYREGVLQALVVDRSGEPISRASMPMPVPSDHAHRKPP